MKKLLLITAFLLGMLNANAQKDKVKSEVIGSPNKSVSRALPDLTFELVPVLVGAGNGFEKLSGTTNNINIPVNFIVKNIGLANSKPCKVYAHLTYQRPRTRVEIEQGTAAEAWLGFVISEPVALQAIIYGKDVLEKQNFVFRNIPEEAWGKRIRLTLKIEYGILNGEQSAKNNQSDFVEFTLLP